MNTTTPTVAPAARARRAVGCDHDGRKANSRSGPIGRYAARVALLALTSVAACSDSADSEGGPLRVSVYGEEFIEGGIPSEEVADGWSVSFSTFLVSVSEIEADGQVLPGNFVIDLAQATGGQGQLLGEIMVDSGGVEHLAYRVGPASSGSVSTLDPAAVEAMALAGSSISVSGVAERSGQTVEFEWDFSSNVRYEECLTEPSLQDEGATSQITIHADHLFYDDLDSEEPNVAFDLIAQADTDGDGDGNVTNEELRGLDITRQDRYQVGSRNITNLWDFIEAQTGTVGHIDGEGHCEAAD